MFPGAAGLRSVCTTLLGGLRLPRCQIPVEFFESGATLLNADIAVTNQFGIRLESGMGLDRLALGECLDTRVAMGSQQYADRHLQLFLELMGERQRECREIAGHAARFPAFLGGYPNLWVQRRNGVGSEFPDRELVLRVPDFLSQDTAQAPIGKPFHVRLAGSMPDFTDKDVF